MKSMITPIGLPFGWSEAGSYGIGGRVGGDGRPANAAEFGSVV